MMSNLEKHLINSTECEKLVKDFDETIYREINRGRPVSKPQSKSFTIELEVLQDYLKMISAEMDHQGIEKKGVRINLGKYPDNLKDPHLDPDFLGYQMVFISPEDLGASDGSDRVKVAENSKTKGVAEIPNLNYMNISPPK